MYFVILSDNRGSRRVIDREFKAEEEVMQFMYKAFRSLYRGGQGEE